MAAPRREYPSCAWRLHVGDGDDDINSTLHAPGRYPVATSHRGRVAGLVAAKALRDVGLRSLGPERASPGRARGGLFCSLRRACRTGISGGHEPGRLSLANLAAIGGCPDPFDRRYDRPPGWARAARGGAITDGGVLAYRHRRRRDARPYRYRSLSFLP